MLTTSTAVRCCAQRTAAWCEGLPHLLQGAHLGLVHVDHHRFDDRHGAPASCPSAAQAPAPGPFRLIPHWNLATGSRLTPRWTRLNLASTIASNDNFGHHVQDHPSDQGDFRHLTLPFDRFGRLCAFRPRTPVGRTFRGFCFSRFQHAHLRQVDRHDFRPPERGRRAPMFRPQTASLTLAFRRIAPWGWPLPTRRQRSSQDARRQKDSL
jgi:hypothetical protein